MSVLPPAFIPNRHGFQLRAVFRDGTVTRGRVRRRATGLHVLVLPFGRRFSDVTGWERIT